MGNTVEKEGLLITERYKRITFINELIKLIDSKDSLCTTIRVIEPPKDSIVRSNHLVVSLIISIISVEVRTVIVIAEYTAALDSDLLIATPYQMCLLSEHLHELINEAVKDENIIDVKGNLLDIPKYLFDADSFRSIIGVHGTIATGCEKEGIFIE